MKAESDCQPNAANLNDHHNGCIGSYGLMQVACIHTGYAAEYDPARNIAKAYEIYRCGQRIGSQCVASWLPWGAFTSGAYLRFM